MERKQSSGFCPIFTVDFLLFLALAGLSLTSAWYSPFRGNAPEGEIRRIFKMAFVRVFLVRLVDCPEGLGNCHRRVKATHRG